MFFVELLLHLLTVYVAMGVLFAIAFVSIGASRIDPAARQATLGFRVAIFPGAAALWPWLLVKWIRP